MRKLLLVSLVPLGLLLGGTAARAAGGALAWKVGADDFVDYRITVVHRTDSQKDGFARWGEVDDVAGFHGYELDREARRVVRDIAHPEMLYVPFVFSLPSRLAPGARSTIDVELGGNWRLEPFRGKGQVSVTAYDADADPKHVGLSGEVIFEPGPLGSPTAYRHLLEGKLSWSARFDLERGLMEEVAYESSWTSAGATEERPRGVHALAEGGRKYQAKIRLDLDHVLTYRYAGFQKDVDHAIEEGLRYLGAQQEGDGSWSRGPHRFGMTALVLLAMLDGGRPGDDPAIQRGFDWLLEQRPWEAEGVQARTYSIGIALMALERLRTPQVEIERRRRQEKTDFLPRHLKGYELAWMTRLTGFLLDTARVKTAHGESKPVTGTPTDEEWRWRYPNDFGRMRPPVNDWDNSNTQYAVLGLESAARCGIKIPDRAWFGIANHFLAVQAPDGPPRRDFRIAPQSFTDPSSPQSLPGGHVYAPEARHARQRGWNYFTVTDPEPITSVGGRPYGSMTTAGIASLAIARTRIAGLEHVPHRSALLDRIDQAILDGFASLDAMFTVWAHPNYEGWYLYYLYGLERAGMLTATLRFGLHDWYWEGAVQLLLRQSSYGQRGPRYWSYDEGSIGSTCWAILFLKRGTPPVITPR